MSFAWPWCFLALPLPWLIRRMLAPVEDGAALRVPSLPAIEGFEAAPRLALPVWIAALAWLLLVIAAARPQAPGDVVSRAVSGRDLMLAFDVSASMGTADLQWDGQPAERLRVARALADDFIQQRQGDRVGLIVFGTQAYLHTPLTFDLKAVHDALAAAQTGLAGRETALGDAIALAAKHLAALAESTRVLVLLTDGANTAGTLAPLRAAWLARRENVRIHAIGIGAGAELDEETLKGIARQTGGTYLRATDGAQIKEFFRRLDTIEPVEHGTALASRTRELYAWPLAMAFALAVWLALRRVRKARA